MADYNDPLGFLMGKPGYTYRGKRYSMLEDAPQYQPAVEMFRPEYLPGPLPVDTAVPERMIDSSIRSSIPMQDYTLPLPQKALAPKIDFNQFPIPTPPPVERMPMRDLAGERRQQSKVSLRAGLIGLLLGGGTGALAGLTGAQQGFQQAADQDYAQRMAEFQGQQQQAQQEYANRVAMTNAMLNRAQAERQQGQEFLDVDYANAVARRNEQARLETERKKTAETVAETAAKERDARIRALSAAGGYTDPTTALEFAMSGTSPSEGLVPTKGVKRPVETAQGRLMVQNFLDRAPFMTAEEFASGRAGLKTVLMDPRNEEVVRNMIRMIPQSKAEGGMQTVQSARLEMQRLRDANNAKAQDARTQDRNRMYTLAVRRLDLVQRNINSLIAARKASKAVKPGTPSAGAKLSSYQTATNNFVKEVNQLIADRNTAVQKQKQGLLDDEDTAYIQTLDSAIQESINQDPSAFKSAPKLDGATGTWSLGVANVLTEVPEPPAPKKPTAPTGKRKYQFKEVK